MVPSEDNLPIEGSRFPMRLIINIANSVIMIVIRCLKAVILEIVHTSPSDIIIVIAIIVIYNY